MPPWAAGAGFGNGEAVLGVAFEDAEFDGVALAGGADIWATSVCGFAAAGCGLVTAWIVGFAGATEAVVKMPRQMADIDVIKCAVELV